MRGSYLVEGVRERFACGAGPQGWRYVSSTDHGDRWDVTLDGSGRALRLVVELDGWVVEGTQDQDAVRWLRDGRVHHAAAAGFTGSCPALDVGAARRLGLQVGESRRVAVVEVTEPVGATRTVRQEWRRTADPEEGLQRYEVGDLATGERWVLHLAGEILISREGARTAWLEGLDTTVSDLTSLDWQL